MREIDPLREAVQLNCHISDARYAQLDTLCVYLLKMREFFRWERGYGFGDSLPKEEIGDWIVRREALWSEVEKRDFAPIELDGAPLDPFEAEPINARLAERGLVYSAGIGRHAKPSFFLGALERDEELEGFRLRVSGEEYARDLAAPPAMLQSGTIYIRRQSLARMIWEKIEEGRDREGHAIQRAMAAYPFSDDPLRAMESMTDHEIERAIDHELGEGLAGRALGPRWEEMLSTLTGRNEILARAVRDHLADSLTTLPRLLEAEDLPSIHFYFANFEGMRKATDPRLAAAYRRFVESGSLTPLALALEGRAEHWRSAAEKLLEVAVTGAWNEYGCLVEALTRREGV